MANSVQSKTELIRTERSAEKQNSRVLINGKIWRYIDQLIIDLLVTFRDVFRVGTGHPAADFRHTPCRHLAVGKKAVGVSAH